MDSAMKKVRLHNRNAIEVHRVCCTSFGPTKITWDSRRQFSGSILLNIHERLQGGHLPPPVKGKNWQACYTLYTRKCGNH